MSSQVLELPFKDLILHHTSAVPSFGYTLDAALPIAALLYNPESIQPISYACFASSSLLIPELQQALTCSNRFLFFFSAPLFPNVFLPSSPSLHSTANQRILSLHPSLAPLFCFYFTVLRKTTTLNKSNLSAPLHSCLIQLHAC